MTVAAAISTTTPPVMPMTSRARRIPGTIHQLRPWSRDGLTMRALDSSTVGRAPKVFVLLPSKDIGGLDEGERAGNNFKDVTTVFFDASVWQEDGACRS